MNPPEIPPPPGATALGPCRVWREGGFLVIDSPIPFADWQVREFAHARIDFEGKSYFLRQKSETPGPRPAYRYVLSPWEHSDGSPGRAIFFDLDYVHAVAGDLKREKRDQQWVAALVLLYPVLGFLWSKPKRWLRRIGYEVNTMSGVSNLVGFSGGLFFGILFQVYLHAGSARWELFVLMVVLLTDCLARFNRSLSGVDEIAPGFCEWLFRPRDRYD
jgi:hypothetical protein